MIHRHKAGFVKKTYKLKHFLFFSLWKILVVFGFHPTIHFLTRLVNPKLLPFFPLLIWGRSEAQRVEGASPTSGRTCLKQLSRIRTHRWHCSRPRLTSHHPLFPCDHAVSYPVEKFYLKDVHPSIQSPETEGLTLRITAKKHERALCTLTPQLYFSSHETVPLSLPALVKHSLIYSPLFNPQCFLTAPFKGSYHCKCTWFWRKDSLREPAVFDSQLVWRLSSDPDPDLIFFSSEFSFPITSLSQTSSLSSEKAKETMDFANLISSGSLNLGVLNVAQVSI